MKDKFELFIEFTELNENWDGYGGIPLLPEIAKIANNFILLLNTSQVDAITDIYPNPHGTISFEWNGNIGKMVLEIGKSGYSYFIQYLTSNPKLVDGYDVLSSIGQIKSEIDNLFIKK